MRTVVVGASSGLGRCIGIGLAQRGASVALLARRRDLLEAAAKEAGPDTLVIECDVTDEASCRSAIADAAAGLGGIDALVYAPGIGPLARLVDTDADTWRRVFETNVTGAALVTSAALPALTASAGTAAYLSSVSASLTPPWPGLGAYAVSKAALDKLVEAWRAEHPHVGFTRVVVGDCAGGEGDAQTQFANGWDTELAAEMATTWIGSQLPQRFAHRRRALRHRGRRGAEGWRVAVGSFGHARAAAGRRARIDGPGYEHRGARMTAATVAFDPFSDEYFNDPTEVYRRLRDEAPVYFNEHYGFYALSRFADVVTAHRDWQGVSSAHGIDLSTLSKDPELIKTYRSIIMMDPPEHDRLRALVSRVFTPRAVAALEPMIREVISGFVAPFEDAATFDAVADFSALFPIEIISRMLGVPEADREQIRLLLDTSLHREAGQLDPTPEGQDAIIRLGTYFYELTVEKRKHPGDDMLTRLTQVTVDRGDGEETGLDDVEIAGFAGLLGGAGAETVRSSSATRSCCSHGIPTSGRRSSTTPRSFPAASRRSCATCRPRSTKAATRSRIGRTKAAPSRPASRCCSSPARRPATHAPSIAPTSSTSNDRRTSRSRSGTACTAAWVPRSRAWRAASRSTSCAGGGDAWRSTRPGCAASTCRTSPATRTCRCARFADRDVGVTARRSPLARMNSQRA